MPLKQMHLPAAIRRDSSRASKTKVGFFADWRNDLIAAGFEFLGTCVFLILSLGTAQSASYLNSVFDPQADASNTADFMYVAAGFGFGLLVAAWLFFRVSGALFNPNISTALLLIGVIKPLRYTLYVLAQLLGGIVAAAVVQGLMPGPLAVSTVPSPRINDAQALFIEMFVTAFLTLAVLMLAVEKHRTTPFAPVGVGMTLFVCELWAVPLTGGALNTARSFGPAVVAGFDGTHWIYWLGPTLGALLASAVYVCMKGCRYWTLAPDQDATDVRKSPAVPVPAIVQRASGSGVAAAIDDAALARAEAGQTETAATAV
ncbi:aquaporin-like protein [Auricularia subglabra TFB-10046 SS5]|nr:aquaporin-like protein [Auricularia subglabra TFB-10046 SS5]